ncbi:MAG TPA: hypothetical protein VN512_02180 [Clostridia bacterium]|nr:hypothetical protein [Clostridia bacterium]
MKKTAMLLAVCLLLALSGCQGNALGGSTAESAAIDSPAVLNSPDGAEQTVRSAEPAETQNTDDDVVEIKEKLFIAQLNDIYLNSDDYLGKTIRYEGMFAQYTWDEMDMTYYLVYRKSPGCCGTDGQAGFEIVWPDGSEKTYPSENDWCEVVGTLESYEEFGQSYLRIVLDTLTVKAERGAEFVSQ